MVCQVTERRTDDNDETSTTMPLAKVIHRKTNGNPYFALQLLRHLCEEGLITYSLITYKWEWNDVDCIANSVKVSDNVSDLLSANLLRSVGVNISGGGSSNKGGTATEIQQALMVAACLGDTVPVQIVEGLFQDLLEGTNDDGEDEKEDAKDSTSGEWEAKFMSMGGYKFTLHPDNVRSAFGTAVSAGMLNHRENSRLYYWSHDKLQQVAYELVDPAIRGPLHVRLGKVLYTMYRGTPSSKEMKDHSTRTSTSLGDDWMVYLAADQFNKAAHYFGDDVGFICDDFARLNLQACKLSISKSAFYPARDMLLAAIPRLDATTMWSNHYDLCLDIYSTLAELELSLGHVNEAMDAVEQVLVHAKTLSDKYRAQIVQLQGIADGNDRNYKEAANMAMKILAEYDMKVMQRPCPTTLSMENRKLKQSMNGDVTTLLDLPLMEDVIAQRKSRILLFLTKFSSMTALASGNPTLCQYTSARLIRMYYEHGITSDTCLALLSHATILKMQGKLTKSQEYADVVEQLANRFPEGPGTFHAKTKAWLQSSIYPSLKPFHKSLDELLCAMKIGLRTGDIESATIASMSYSFSYLCIGLNLTALESDVQNFGQDARLFCRAPSLVVVFDIIQQTILNLMGDYSNDDPTVLNGTVMNQDDVIASMAGQSKAMTLRDIRTFQLMLSCVYGDFDVAKKLVDQVSSYSFLDPLCSRRHIRLMYLGLASVIIGRQKGWCKKCKYGKLGKKIIKLFQAETEMGNVNAHPVLTMLLAEEKPSKELYDDAIRVCARSGLMQVRCTFLMLLHYCSPCNV